MSFYKNKKVLITGAAGLIGHELVKVLLERDAKVRAIVYKNRALQLEHPNLEKIYGNFNYYERCLNLFEDMDIVLDAAAVIGGAKKQKVNYLMFPKYNAIMQINIITAAVVTGVKTFGFIGSSTMYPEKDFVVEEDGFKSDPWPGYMAVGWTKRYLEKLCMIFHETFDTNFAIARTTAVYGPHDDFNLDTCHVIPAMINKIAHKQDPLEVWGDGKEKRNFIYVSDFVEGFLKVVEHKADADPINITSCEISTVNDIIKYATSYMKYNPVINYDLSKPTMIPKRIVSTAKSNDILGWEAQISLERGIQLTLDWFLHTEKRRTL